MRKCLALLGVAIALVSWSSGCSRRNEYAPPPPPTVLVAQPIERSVTDYVELTGTTQATARVELRARVSGYLESIHFEDGADVQPGQILFVIDKRPFQATLEAARAKQAEAEASLKAARESRKVQTARTALLVAQAQLLTPQLDEARGRQLLQRNALSSEEYERYVADLRTAQARVEAAQAELQQAEVDYESGIALAEAALASARAAVTDAELQLSFTDVRAPIGGRIGRRMVDVGNLVQPQTTLLATIEAYDPIYVYFTISESQMLHFTRLREQKVLPPLGSAPIVLTMGLADEEGFPHEGRFDFAELGVDPQTGTTMRRGIFPNPKGTIVPGLFARIRGAIGEPELKLLVPERSLASDQRGRYVLVVNDQGIVEQRPVELGIQVGDLRVVERGLERGDWVIVEGLLRARPGAEVRTQRVEVPAADGADSSTGGPAEAGAPAKEGPPAAPSSKS